MVFLPHALLNNFFQPSESSAADKQNVGGVYGSAFLVGMFAPALRGNVGHGAFQNLQQGLLDAFARNIAGDGRILVLLGDLIDLIDIDDSLLRALHIAAGILQQASK